MSQYSYIVCRDCQEAIWLGKVVRDKDGRISYFHAGSDGSLPNSKNEVLTRALWKFLAGHAGHQILVTTEGDPFYDCIGDYREIGGDDVLLFRSRNILLVGAAEETRATGDNPSASQWSRQANGYFRWQDAKGSYLDIDGNVVPDTHTDFAERTHIMYEGV
jgi:hypothetical protein